MSRPRRTKPDANQAQIVDELRSLGFDVDVICDLGGLYDIVVSGELGMYAVSVRVEIKSEDGELNCTELRYLHSQNWPESYIVARNTADIVQWFNG